MPKKIPNGGATAVPAMTKRPAPGAGARREIDRATEQPRMPQKTIDLGSIDDLRILNEQGEADGALDPKLPNAELLKIHRAMVLTRKFDIRMLNMQRQGEMGTF